MVIFSTYIDPHPANSHIFNIYRSTYIYFQQLTFFLFSFFLFFFFFFFWERTCQILMYSNLPTLKIQIHIYSIKPVKYQYKIHIHIYRCILPNINIFNLPTLMIHTHTFIEPAIFFFSFGERTCQISIYSNLLTLKIHVHTYTYATCQISIYSTC